MAWHRSAWTGLLPRAIGLAALGGAALAARALLHLGGRFDCDAPGLVPLMLALVAFLCASGGSALLLLGVRLLDPVRVSRPWLARRTRAMPPARQSLAGKGCRAQG